MQPEEFYDNSTLTDIYRQISITDNDEFDYKEEEQLIVNLLETKFPIEFRRINNQRLIDDINLLNQSFVKLVKFCQEVNFFKTNIIFIVFCDYFDLNYGCIYSLLHKKIQEAIKKRYIKMVGHKEYYSQKQKHEVKKDFIQPTLFDF